METILVRLTLCAFIWAPEIMARPAWIELSHPFNDETIYWPGLPTFNLTRMFDGYQPGGYYLLMYSYGAAEHGGTHIDAPRHFSYGKWTLDEIPLQRLIGPAIKIDISSKAAQNADAELTTSDLQAWEEKHGRIPDDVILLVFSDWAKFWPDKKTYLGTDTGNTSLLHFPGIHPNASRWLVKNRKIKMVGIDTPSMDYGQSKIFESHQILYKENIPGLENVAHMDKLPAKGFTLYAAPMFVTGGSGGPCRIFARLDEDDKKDSIESSAVKFKGEALFFGISLFFVRVFL